jgi:predicted metal-dependent enzyme (double-stranded beta helix superfamily)
MVKALLSFLLLLPGSLQTYPHAFPREGAKQLIDNERVTVWEVTWPKGKSTGMHEHKFDMVAVDLADATTKLTTPDGRSQTATQKRATAGFLQKGVIHAEEGTSDVPRHAILVDLKDVVVPPLANKSGLPNAFPRDGVNKLLENNRVIIWDYTWKPGKPTVMHFHDKDVVVVYLENGELKSTTPDGKADTNVISFGLTKFNRRDRIHSEELVKGSARAIIVEFK